MGGEQKQGGLFRRVAFDQLIETGHEVKKNNFSKSNQKPAHANDTEIKIFVVTCLMSINSPISDKSTTTITIHKVHNSLTLKVILILPFFSCVNQIMLKSPPTLHGTFQE